MHAETVRSLIPEDQDTTDFNHDYVVTTILGDHYRGRILVTDHNDLMIWETRYVSGSAISPALRMAAMDPNSQLELYHTDYPMVVDLKHVVSIQPIQATIVWEMQAHQQLLQSSLREE